MRNTCPASTGRRKTSVTHAPCAAATDEQSRYRRPPAGRGYQKSEDCCALAWAAALKTMPSEPSRIVVPLSLARELSGAMEMRPAPEKAMEAMEYSHGALKGLWIS